MPSSPKPQPVDISDESKTREQLLSELRELKARMTILENTESESKHAKEALVISERQALGLDATLESIAAGVVIYDSSGSIVRMNNVAMDLFQYSLDQYRQPVQQRGARLQMCKLDGTPYLPDELPYVRVMKGKIIRDEEMIVSLSSGKTVWLSATLSPIRVKNSAEITGIVFVFADITERKRMEEALRRSHDELEQRVGERTVELQRLNNDLTAKIEERKRAEEAFRESEEKYRIIVETANEGIIMVNPSGTIIFTNTRMADMLSYTVEELVGMEGAALVGQEEQEKSLKRIEKRKSGIKEGYDLKFIRKDGSELWTHANGTPIYDSQGTHIGNMAMYTDITERKRAEDELKEAKMQAEMYLDLMGHDINNLNQIALGYLELASSTLDINCESEKLITRPMDALYRSSKLIENVKNIQKMKSGTKAHAHIDIGNAIVEAINTFAHVPDRSITINHVPVNGWYVKADELLKEVLDNLLANAVKHSPCDKPLIIDIELSKITENGQNFYRVTVTDNGTGIPDNKKLSIFGRFSKGHKMTRGSGLGLYVTKTLVEYYGGSVWVEDRVMGDHTKGAKFVVMLPAVEK